MDISGLKTLYRNQQLAEANIIPATQGEGWILDCKNNEGEGVILTDSLGREACFKSHEMALSQANEIGFSHVNMPEF
ncbi:hypothetical protein [Motilimonas sp. KMU-193]|uniref:hypothetical protein n=1 Tax=Motilimonas sp. KMU-193 TaxID=3388668 RepID=UPI00396B3DCF